MNLFCKDVICFQDVIDNISNLDEAKRLLHIWADESPRQAHIYLVQPTIPSRPIHGPTPKYCVCGQCVIMEKDVMNFCCGQSICLSTTSTFSDLTKASVIEVAGITNYCDAFHQVSDYTPNLFRNSAYRFIILWQCDRLGKGKRVCPPSCCVARIRFLYPSPDNNYTGYESFEEIEDEN